MFSLLISTSTCVVKSEVKDTCSIFFCPTGVFMNLIQKVIIMGVPNEALRHNKVNEDTDGSLCVTLHSVQQSYLFCDVPSLAY
jgi:hypothetical protein